MVTFEPYTIQCMTCNAQLRVEREEAIGKILACPNCQSMVQIEDSRPPATPVEHEALESHGTRCSEDQTQLTLRGSTTTGEPIGFDPMNDQIPSAPRRQLPQWLVLPIAALAGIIFAIGLWSSLRQTPDRHLDDISAASEVLLGAPSVTQGSESRKSRTSVPPAQGKSLTPPLEPQVVSIADSKETTKVPVASTVISSQESPIARVDQPATGVENPPREVVQAKNEEPTAKPALQEISVASIPRLPLPPPTESLKEKLDTSLLEIEFKDISLRSAISILAHLSNAEIVFDHAALIRAGISPETPTRLQRKNSSVGNNLDKLLQPLGLVAIPSGDSIFISLPDITDQSLSEQTYTLNAAKDAERMERVIRTIVFPWIGQRPGVAATIRRKGNQLFVVQTMAGHSAIHRLLTQMQYLRTVPTGYYSSGTSADAENPLDQIIDWGTRQALPLDTYLQQLAYRLGSQIVLDELSLMRSGISVTQPIEVKADQQTLGNLIDQTLRPLRLGAQAMDDRSVIIGSEVGDDPSLVLRIYPLPTSTESDPYTILQLITEQIAPDSWAAVGGEGQIMVEKYWGGLIVLQSPDVQGAIFRFLSDSKSD